MLENNERCIKLFMQEIFDLIEKKSSQINFSKKTDQNKILHIIINFDELTTFYNREILLNALYRLRILDYKWMSFKNEDGTYGETLFHFIDYIAFSKEKLRFETSYFFLSELKKNNFNVEQYLLLNQQ